MTAAPQTQQTQPLQSNGFGTAALVLGIIGAMFAFIPIAGAFIAVPLGVLALIFGVIGIVRGARGSVRGKGTSIAGTVLGGVALVLSIVMAAAVFGGPSSTSTLSTGPASSAGSNTGGQAVPYGETATVGDLKVTLTDYTQQQSIGPEIAGQQARGTYRLVSVEATNTGNQAQSFGNITTVALDAQGNEYQSDPAGFMLQANQGSGGLMTPINPGSTATGTLVFDVPDNRNLTKVKVTSGFLNQPRNFQLPN